MLGTTLSHYQIVDLLGKGGMGEVYRAHDPKLGRDVALKILPPEVSGDPERVARFAREARTLASLQHPNVASIHGFDEVGGVRFLVMELAEGEDLSGALARGPIPIEDAIPLARQIAAGLEAAHERGIVHRDLKPANIQVSTDGTVKILDFGLARAYADDSDEDANLEHSPTITAAMTGAGVILGTAAYMSPEQARGRPIDSRADIWSFGVVLFEMLTGQRLFEGETVSDTLASVLKTDIDWDPLPGDVPPRVRTLLRRCLERDRDRRLRDIGEARIALEDELGGAPDAHLESVLHSGQFPAAEAATPTRGRRTWPPLVAAAVIGAGLTFASLQALGPDGTVEVPLRKLALDSVQDNQLVTGPVVSPDGRAVAFLTPDDIVVREMSAREVRRFPVTETVEDLFWSPDGRFLAYIVPQRMYRLDASTGQQQVVCEGQPTFNPGAGGAWGDDGTILFSQADTTGFFRVSDRGGDPRQVLPADPGKEGDFHDPCVLPGGRGIIFVPHLVGNQFTQIDVWDGEERRTVIQIEGQALAQPVYSPTGHILFERSPTNPGIWAVPFSLENLEATGEPFLVAPAGTFPSVAGDGTLVYSSGSQFEATRLTWNDAAGRELRDTGPSTFDRSYFFPALTSDGRLACAGVDGGNDSDLWIFDAVRGTRTRLTFGDGREEWPVWTPSQDAVLYHIRPEGSTAIGTMRVVRVAADGTGQPDTLAVGFIPSVSPDGRYVAFSRKSEGQGWINADLAFRPLDEDRSQGTRLVGAAGLQMDANIAPGGEYVAYASNESGRFEVYLTRFPSGTGRWQVSIEGGTWPRWNATGDRLFYAQGDAIMAVEVTLGASPELGRPELVLERPPLSAPTIGSWAPGFGVTADGSQFLYFRDEEAGMTDHEIVVVQNWFAEFSQP